jgi:hypothetical protein
LTVGGSGNYNLYICQPGQPCTISVTYTSPAGHEPTAANVLIDGTRHPMTAGAGSVTSGQVYSYTTSALPTGSHYIQLEFNDGSGLRDFQEGLMAVTPIVLQDEKVSPASGTTSTPFNFSIVYIGPDAPAYVDVVVDGIAHPLSYVSGSYTSGAAYSATMSLPAGSHTYAFTAADAADAWSDPQSPGTFTGPQVTAAGEPPAHPSPIAPPPSSDGEYSYDGG